MPKCCSAFRNRSTHARTEGGEGRRRLQAEALAAKTSQFFVEIVSQVGWTTYLSWSENTIDQRRFDALRLFRQAPAITDIVQLDTLGKEQLRISRLSTHL